MPTTLGCGENQMSQYTKTLKMVPGRDQCPMNITYRCGVWYYSNLATMIMEAP